MEVETFYEYVTSLQEGSKNRDNEEEYRALTKTLMVLSVELRDDDDE